MGREAELAALAAARSRSPQAVVVAGEAGIGKSRLVEEFVAGGSSPVFRGAADPGGPPYGPLVSVLRRVVRHLGVRQAVDLLPGNGRTALARLLPELGPQHEPDRARLFEEVLLLLEGVAGRGEVIVLVEDLHWADVPARDLLVFLLRNLTRPGVLVIGTTRDTQGLWPLLRLDTVELLTPPALGREDVARMLGRPPDSPEVARILRRSEGNPLFVEALADVGTATPGALRDLLLAGVERLEPESLAVLRAVAVAGLAMEHIPLRDMTGLDDLALDDALRPLVRGRFLRVETEGYAFRHVLIRDAVYDDVPLGERARLHARCAAALAERPDQASDHWHAAGDRRRAMETAWQAGKYERVLDLWDETAMQDVDHARVLELAAENALHAGAADRAEELATAAIREVDPEADPARVARLLTLRVTVRDQLGEDGLDDLREAVRLAPDSPRLTGALAATLAWNGQYAEAHAHATRAVAQGDTGSVITLASLAAADGDMESATALYARAQAAAGDDDTLLSALAAEADALEAAGEHSRAEVVARRGMTHARGAGRARSLGTLIAANLAEPLASLGRWDEARQVVAAALALDPPPIYRAWLLIVDGTVAAWRGDTSDAEEILRLVRPLTRGRSRGEDSCLEPDLLACRLAQLGGDVDRLRRLLGHVLETHDLTRSRRYAWPLLAAAAQAGIVPGLPLESLPAIGRLQWAHRATYLAECGEGAWDEAIALWRQVGQPHALGSVLLRAGGHAVHAGDHATAQERLREAASIAGSLGALPLAGQVAAVAATARIVLDPAPVLSPRELEVLTLVAEGLSNRQIADRLFISPRTSGVHVSNIMAKLGASNRVHAAAIARHHGLL
ncbi:LuxR family transcriptional regulator [Planotetraspora phitsanulokensis]